MYLLLIAILVAAGGMLAVTGRRHGRRWQVFAGITIIVATAALFGALSLWGEALWFHALGYGRRFWLFLATQAICTLTGAGVAAAGVHLLNAPLRNARGGFSRWPELIGAAGGAMQGLAGWTTVLVWLNRTSADVTEPIWSLDAGFYLFTLPFLDLAWWILAWIVVVSGGSLILAGWIPTNRRSARDDEPDWNGLETPLKVTSLVAALVAGLAALRSAFHLLYSETGVVTGPGWTDVHVRLPGALILSALVPMLAAAVFVPRIREYAAALATRFKPMASPTLAACGGLWLVIAASSVLIGGLAPWLAQRLLVEPNEITLEEPYIANNIALTRSAYGLSDVEERQFPVSDTLARATIELNENLISELRLWDWRALDAVYKQFQEIRLYYEFDDVDLDRYRLGDRYREVMVSAREVAQENLPSASQTFVNKRFKYTHGYGLTLATVSDFTPSGLPNLLIRDIPPVVEDPRLAVERPEIYYGELTSAPVVANTSEPEFDYPSGEENIYVHYAGDGGVELRNLWRKFLFGWKLDGTPFLLSSYPDADSRVMFHRQIRQRARRLAPFLSFDEDPYIVLADGRLYWILDAYTHSARFPYSTHFEPAALSDLSYSSELAYLQGSNYIRNSVKVVIDAYEGSVDFYVFEPEDPLIRVWRNALPDMFHDSEEMPDSLRRHVRYPQDLLLTQGLVYAKYHMSDPAVFYNQEDLWVRATERHYDRTQNVEPYYIMWQPPGSDSTEFVLMLPFTPKDRQVLVGWIAGLSDGENYGRFLAYKFPKEKRVLGPQQVETKIDQDRFLSGQLTLWDQRGSNVIRGNVLAIPLDGSLLYVEPIYLQAETAAYPELRVVVVMHGDNMSYGDTLDAALEGLFGAAGSGTRITGAESGGESPDRALAIEARDAFEHYLEAQGAGRFQDAAGALERLESALTRLSAADDNDAVETQ